MNLELDGRCCLVTGGSRGLGRAIALALAAEGAKVLVTGRDAAALASARESSGGRIETHTTDLSEIEAVAALPDTTAERLGALDVLVNCAGVAQAMPFVEQTAHSWQEAVAVNVLAPAVLTRAAAHYLSATGGGKVINVASVGGLRGKAGLVAYGTAKGALIAFTRALAVEWAPRDVQVNAIAPGAFATDMQGAVLNDPELLDRRVRRIPARRMATAEEIGPLACYLASPRSAFVTGAVFVIDGGEEAKL